MQGQLLAARMGWRWLSAGQLLRDTKDPALLEQMQTGEMIDNDRVNAVISEALKRAEDMDKVILDSFPRRPAQAKWLVESQPEHGRAVDLVIVLDISEAELQKRLHIRGRLDDAPAVVAERLAIYEQEITPTLEYLASQDIAIAHVNGEGTVGQVHDRIVEELDARGLAK